MEFLTLMVVVAILINCNIMVYAKDAQTEGTIEYVDADLETKVLPTDIKMIYLEQIGQQIIPTAPFNGDLVQNAEVIYRLRYKVTAKRYNNQVVTNLPIEFVCSTGPVKGTKFTAINSSGVGYIDMDVRGAHDITAYCRLRTSYVKSNTVRSRVGIQAKYAQKFYCTAYNTALESDYTGTKTNAVGIANDTFYKDFLAAVKLNGSGKAKNGKYLHYNATKKSYSYQSPKTATGTTPTVGRTIAVDPYYIPRAKVNGVWKRATVLIANIGQRVAEDGGGAIKGYHIDVYMGLGKSSLRGWGNAYCEVTLLSVNK